MVNFLTFNEVIEIHEDVIKRYGGSLGIRDQGLLLSALGQPQSTFSGEYLHKDLFRMGAAYLFHLCKNHPFIDGNKRTAVAVTLMFFFLNEVEIDVDNDLLTEMVLAVINEKLDKETIAKWFRKYAAT